ncbi:21417_t:CDS:2, partial [Gigaspora rosea]
MIKINQLFRNWSVNDLAMDLFHVLGSGARFDKKRFNDDISLFE